MKVVLCTLLLNEQEWLPKLYEQHKDWPGLQRWVFVESADAAYADANPDRVTAEGLSVDGTTETLDAMRKADDRVTHLRVGTSRGAQRNQGKCRARSAYLEAADRYAPDLLVVLDADEFYPFRQQYAVAADVERRSAVYQAFCYRQRQVWCPPACGLASEEAFSLFQYEAVGGFWAIPHCRVWRWRRGLRYGQNHNTPETGTGQLLDRHLLRADLQTGTPELCHLGFAASLAARRAKHRYYEQRGEGADRARRWYVESRAAWETWTPGTVLPRGAKVQLYDGDIPEVFRG